MCQMKYLLPVLLLLLWACNDNSKLSQRHNETTHHHDDGHVHDHHAEEHNHEGAENEHNAIIIEPEQAEKFGIKTLIVEEVPFTEAIKVSAEISAPPASRKSIIAKTSGIFTLAGGITPGIQIASGQKIGSVSGSDVAGGDVGTSLRIEYETAKTELERITPLYEKGIISKKDYNAAKLTFDKAKAALGNGNTGTTGNVSSPSSGTLLSLLVSDGDFVETGRTIAYVGDNTNISLKADLPKRLHSKARLINDAFLVPSCDDCLGFRISDVGGKRIGEDIVQDNISGFLPIYFSFNNNGLIESNGYIDAYLLLDSSKPAIALPESALSEQQGQWFAYVKLDDDCYEKVPVNRGGSNGNSVEILSGLNVGDEVVTQGVTFLRLAENANVVPEGHTHNH